MLIQSAEREIATDVCVVGSGPAGISLALALDGKARVLLSESGGFETDDFTRDLSQGFVAGRLAPFPDYPQVTRMRQLGGSTGHWGGQCRPLEPEDLRAKSWVPLSGWPIAWSDLAPWYARAAEMTGVRPFEPVPRGAFSVYSRPFRDDAIEARLFHFSAPLRFGEAYRERIVAAKDLSLLLHATCVRLSSTGGRLDGATFRRPDGSEIRVSAKRFVLAAGGIENARLLLDAGLGGDWAGRCFMEHPALPVGRFVIHATRAEEASGLWSLWRGFVTPEVGRARPALVTTAAFQEREKTLGFSTILLRDDAEELDLEAARLAHRIDSDVRKRDLDAGSEPLIGTLIAQVEQAPNRDSRITLAEERDRLGVRKARIDWRLSQLDLRTIHVSTVEVGKALARLGCGRARIDVEADRLETVGYNNHHLGTTRMSARPEEGVVDANSRVHGVENLWIAGSSVFPTGGFANPTFTLVALALRLGAHLGAL